MFPDNPDVWLKDLVSLMNLRLSIVPFTDLTFEGKSPGEFCYSQLIVEFCEITNCH